MGTTVTMAYQLGSQLCVVHVGDSRAYVYRDDSLHQLTQDHTMVADMVRAGTLKPEDAAGHRLRHVVTNVVGGPTKGCLSKPMPWSAGGRSAAALLGWIDRDGD